MDPALALVVLAALAFAYVNGMHDASNAIATSVATRALTPRVAVAMSAVLNLLGALLGEGIARTVGEGVIHPTTARIWPVLLCALLSGIAWNLLTWHRGMPSSSTHALVGGLIGAAGVSGVAVHWSAFGELILLPLVVSPLVGLALAYPAMLGLMWLLRDSTTAAAERRLKMGQTVSAAAMSLGHGLQDGQKTMAVIVLALSAGTSGSYIPLWVKLAVAVALALGTAVGGWPIIRTLGRRICKLDSGQGFVAESVSSTLLYLSGLLLQVPVSTTHTITASVVGASAARRVSGIRWHIVGQILLAWVVTMPATAIMAGIGCWLVNLAL